MTMLLIDCIHATVPSCGRPTLSGTHSCQPEPTLPTLLTCRGKVERYSTSLAPAYVLSALATILLIRRRLAFTGGLPSPNADLLYLTVDWTLPISNQGTFRSPRQASHARQFLRILHHHQVLLDMLL